MKKYNLQKQLHQLALLSGCLLTLSSVWAAEHPPRVATPEGKAPGDAIVVFDGEGKEALLAVTIPERPGSFLEFCRILGESSVTEFNYRYAGNNNAHVFIGVHLEERSRQLQAQSRK